MWDVEKTMSLLPSLPVAFHTDLHSGIWNATLHPHSWRAARVEVAVGDTTLATTMDWRTIAHALNGDKPLLFPL